MSKRSGTWGPRVIAMALVLGMLAVPWLSIDASAEVTYLVDEDFTSGMGGWSDRLAYAGSSVVTLSEQYRHDGPCLAVNGNTDLRYVLGSPISTSTDLHVSFWIAIGTMPSNKVSTVFAAVYETSASIAGPRLTLGYGSSSYASLNNYPDGGSSYQVYQLTYGTWYHVELESHNSNTEFDLTVNGAFVGTYQTYEGEPMFGDTITEFQIYSSNGSPYPNYYLDDYVVTTGSESGGENPPSGNAPVTFAHDPGTRTITITPSAEVAEYTRGSVASSLGEADFDDGTLGDFTSNYDAITVSSQHYRSAPNSMVASPPNETTAVLQFSSTAYPRDRIDIGLSMLFEGNFAIGYDDVLYSGNNNPGHISLGLHSIDGVTAEAYLSSSGDGSQHMTGAILSMGTWYDIIISMPTGWTSYSVSINDVSYGPYEIIDPNGMVDFLTDLELTVNSLSSGSLAVYVDDVSVTRYAPKDQPIALVVQCLLSGVWSMVTGQNSKITYYYEDYAAQLSGSYGYAYIEWTEDIYGGLSSAIITYSAALATRVAEIYDAIEGLTIAIMNVILGHPPGVMFSDYASEYYSASIDHSARTITLTLATGLISQAERFIDPINIGINAQVGIPATTSYIGSAISYTGPRGTTGMDAGSLSSGTVVLSWSPQFDPYTECYELWQALLTSHIHAAVGGLPMPTWELASDVPDDSGNGHGGGGWGGGGGNWNPAPDADVDEPGSGWSLPDVDLEELRPGMTMFGVLLLIIGAMLMFSGKGQRAGVMIAGIAVVLLMLGILEL